LTVIIVVCTTVPDLPLSTARSELDVQFPVSVVALMKCKKPRNTQLIEKLRSTLGAAL
jgi:hypothetical protein